MTNTPRQRLAPFRGLIIGWAAVIIVANALATASHEILGPEPAISVTFAVLLIVAQVALPLRRQAGIEAPLPWAFTMALVFVAPSLLAMLTVIVAHQAVILRTRRSSMDALYAGSSIAIGISVGCLAGSQIVELCEPTQLANPTSLWLVGAFTTAAVTYIAARILLTFGEAQTTGISVTKLVTHDLADDGAIDALQLTVAPLLVVIAIEVPALLPLLVVIVAAVSVSATMAKTNRHNETHDPVTGTPNHPLFEEQAALLLRTAERDQNSAALIYIGLEGTDGITDRLGNSYRDAVLCEVAERLREEARAIDLVARRDHATFTVLLGRIEHEEDATIVARRLVDATERRMEIDGVPIGIGSHAGVALFPRHARSLSELAGHAEMAMARADNSISGVETVNIALDESPGGNRFDLLADLDGAVERDELFVVYQPKIHARSGEITSVEALIRWRHPIHGLIAPDRFMPQAEHTDLINAITDTVIDKALAQLAEWHAEGRHIGMAINASARNLHDLRFPERVRTALLRHGVAASYLEIEITENAVLEDPTRSASVLGHLRGLGVTLSIDDFGTGYSSLSSLRRLTIDRIKIDRSFVAELATNGGDLTIVRSVIDLSRNLGLATVAEGVETMEVLEIVRDLGCDEMQGFLISPPVAAPAITVMLHERSFHLRFGVQSAGTTGH